MRLYFLGFMGCGKSFLGKQLAAKLDWSFLDLDSFLEEGEGQSISTIFKTKGAAHFRKLEAQYLKKTLNFERVVVATGGGTPCFFDNINWINEHGISIYFKTAVSLLADRLETEKEHRPLLANLTTRSALEDFIQQKIAERSSFYEQTHLIYHQKKSDSYIVDKLYLFFKDLTPK